MKAYDGKRIWLEPVWTILGKSLVEKTPDDL